MKKVAIVQSNYIPWKGYFDLIAYVDEFIIYDDMQYTRRDWRNRNQIKTPQGKQWLTVPVKVKGKYLQTIRETELDGIDWAEKHWKALEQNYRRANCFQEIAAWLRPLYEIGKITHLTELNQRFLESICGYLGIGTKLSCSWDYPFIGEKSERLASLCAAASGQVYVSGPAAKDYLLDDVFSKKSIKVEWFEYSGYPTYKQLWGEFEHGVTILDMLFNCGSEFAKYLKYVR